MLSVEPAFHTPPHPVALLMPSQPELHSFPPAFALPKDLNAELESEVLVTYDNTASHFSFPLVHVTAAPL